MVSNKHINIDLIEVRFVQDLVLKELGKDYVEILDLMSNGYGSRKIAKLQKISWADAKRKIEKIKEVVKRYYHFISKDVPLQ